MDDGNPIKNVLNRFLRSKPQKEGSSEEKVEEELPFDQEYWIIFREGFRENRIEMSTVDSDMDRQDLCIIWDGGLTLNITDGMSECDQYYLNSAGEWKQIGEYDVLSNYATEVIASNLDVYDSAGNLIVSKTDYSDVDIDELVAETAGNTGEDENSVGFSDEDLQGIAASLGVPEDVFILLKKTEYLRSYGVELFPVPYGGTSPVEGDLTVDRQELVDFIESNTVTFSDNTTNPTNPVLESEME